MNPKNDGVEAEFPFNYSGLLVSMLVFVVAVLRRTLKNTVFAR